MLLPENGSAISVLSCQMCGINFSAVQLLCDALKNNRRLTKLNLYGNSIGDAGAEYVAEMLKVNSSLTYLNLGKNNILDQGGLHLARVFGVLHGDDIDLELQPRQFDISNYSPQLNGYHHSYYRKETTVVNTVLTKPTNPDQLIYLNKFHLNKSIAFLSIERNLLAKEVQAAFRKIMERNQKVHVDLAYCDNPNAEDCVIS